MNAHALPAANCWICGHPADTGEHRFKASDIRRLMRLSQAKPAYLQTNMQATNKEIGSAKSKALQFSKSLCGDCNHARTQAYDRAWERLYDYIRSSWVEIRMRGSLDLAVPFGNAVERQSAALDVHLFFLKLFGCKIVQDQEPIDVSTIAACILTRQAHPEISLYLANGWRDRRILAFESDVYKMWHRVPRRLDGALWGYVVRPIAVKVCLIRIGVPLYSSGYPWHPSRPRQFLRLSPYRGAIEPIPGKAVER